MRKRDEELKIDISDIFGGELSSPAGVPEDGPAVQASETATPEQDSQFQEWMDQRDEALQVQTHELERKLHDSIEASFPQAPDEQVITAEEAVTAPAPETQAQPEESAPESPIDFSAPIAPPFMGGAPAAPSTPELDPEKAAEVEKQAKDVELKKLQAEHEFLMLYDEFRNILLFELKDLVGEKKAMTMLSRTVELARGQFPEVFRNTNWDAHGNLLEDGSLDAQRLIDNKNTMGTPKGDETLDAALSTLLRLRLQAIEKGLGAGLKNKIRARMFQWVTEKGKKSAIDGKPSRDFQRLSGYIMLL
ncbi:MAG TPA: hypothetical protein VHE12_07040 [bacterium]|nr:hypothetical protein [bacterium]